jgi:hypothetical protein
MNVLASIKVESFLFTLEHQAVPYILAKNHIGDPCIVVHSVINERHQCFLADLVEVDAKVCYNLHAYVSLREADEAADIQFMVLLPNHDVFIIFLIIDKLVEANAYSCVAEEHLIVD